MSSKDNQKILTPFSTLNGLVGWVDVLGVRKMEETRCDVLYDSLAKFDPGGLV
jgi:hypothetical protein